MQAAVLVPVVTDTVEKVAPIAGKAATGVSKVTLSFVERIAMAGVIFICIILLIIGLSRFFDGNYKDGLFYFIIGGGGMGGVYFWMRNTAVEAAFGASEPVEGGGEPQEGCDCRGGCACEGGCGCGSSTLLGGFEGAHEKSILKGVKKLGRLLELPGSEEEFSKLKEKIQSAGRKAEEQLHETLELLQGVNKEEIKSSFQKLPEEQQKQVLEMLEDLKRVLSEVDARSKETEEKLTEVTSFLSEAQ